MPFSMLMQLALGAFETAAYGRPLALIQSKNWMKPGRGLRLPAAHHHMTGGIAFCPRQDYCCSEKAKGLHKAQRT